MKEYIAALDQGTTSSRAIVFDRNGSIVSMAQHPFEQIYPKPGWVEHNPFDILQSQLIALREAVEKCRSAGGRIAAVGIANQRETTIVWDRKTGQPVYNAIVWQCRRTAEMCDALMKDQGFVDYAEEKTGLLIDAYFSATKIKWILSNIAGAAEKAENGRLLFGTVDSWLIWNLSGKHRTHVSDYSNCARTMLFDIRELRWDREICRKLGIPVSMLPEPVANSAVYCRIDGEAVGIPELDGVPVCGSAGDQQAALFGQACFSRGEAKNTYGTGCFTLMNTGEQIVHSSNGLIPTVAWSLGGRTTYALEGSVFNGGSTIQWLKDELGLISEPHECDILAEQTSDSGGVYVVPAFTGLGAPYWDMYARGTIIGITRGTNKKHIARAVLEGIAYQVYDLIKAMQADTGTSLPELRVDGGACVSDVMMQFQAELLGCPVNRPACTETTAMGAAYLAGLAAGVWNSTDEIKNIRTAEQIFMPGRVSEDTEKCLRGWHRAVERASRWAEEEQGMRLK
ncbi:MAG: glycerol kinase GlpK [Eubacteriales bacterium]|jgi:glycerol kinase|nr:glycerol kinase GlpK [Eubacteriales bacterium]